jgi:hypothetical protein
MESRWKVDVAARVTAIFINSWWVAMLGMEFAAHARSV